MSCPQAADQRPGRPIGEDRQIAGVEDGDAAARLVDNVARNHCEPPVTVVQEVLHPEEAEKPVLVVNIPQGDMRAYRTNRGVYFIRTTSGNRHASREELLRLFQATESLFYDETPMHRLSLSDLDLDAFERLLERTGQGGLDPDRERLLRNWNLVEDGHPTLAGVVLIGREPQRHLPYAQINAARFPGDRRLSGPVGPEGPVRPDPHWTSISSRWVEPAFTGRHEVPLHLLDPRSLQWCYP